MDYQAIIDSLTEEKVKRILEKLEIPFEDKGSFLLMPTYCHHHKSEEASHKLYYYKNNKVFMCYSECQAMSIFKFLKNYYDSQGYEWEWHRDIYSLIVDDITPEGFVLPKYRSLKDTYGIIGKKINLPEYNKEVLDCFIKKYPQEWLNEGISREAMDKYDIRFSISQNKIIIPHYDVNNRLIGIRGRALNEWEIENVGKYMPVQVENTWYKHPLSMNLYGLNFNKNNIKRTGICYLFESEKAVMMLESTSMVNCGVAVCGSQFNKYSLHMLMKFGKPREIVICFDNEEKKRRR